jgi:excisionase family DNA binding protein
MKVYHRPDVDYLSIDFTDELEHRSVYEKGIITRYNKKGAVIGIDITDSLHFFMSGELLTLQEACHLLKISESTMRRLVRAKKIKGTKPNGKDFRFKKSDLIKFKKSA